MTLNVEIIRAAIAEIEREQAQPHTANFWMFIKVLNDANAELSALLYYHGLAQGYPEGMPEEPDRPELEIDFGPKFVCEALSEPRGATKERRSGERSDERGDAYE